MTEGLRSRGRPGYLPPVHRVRIWTSLLGMKKKLSPKQVLAVRCPTCRAGSGEKRELSTGLPRTEPHRDRRLVAKN